MSEYLKRVHKRLIARAMRADDETWKTINGTHVLVEEGTGEIKKGPEALKKASKTRKSGVSSASKHTVKYERIPYGALHKYGSLNDKKIKREILKNFMKDAKVGNRYTTGIDMAGTQGGFEIVSYNRSPNKMGIRGGDNRTVALTSDNLLKYISNGATWVNPEEHIYGGNKDTTRLRMQEEITRIKNGETRMPDGQWAKLTYSGVENNEPTKRSRSTSKPVDVSKFSFTNYRNPDCQGRSGYETLRSSLESASNETERVKDKVLKSYWGGIPPAEQARTEFGHIMRHSSFRDIAEPSAQQGVKDAFKAISQRQGNIVHSLEDYTEWDWNERRWVIPNKSKKKLR